MIMHSLSVLHFAVVCLSLMAAEVTGYRQLGATEAGVEVRGIVVLDHQLYVVRKNSSQIDVLHPVTLSPVTSITVSGMTNPGSMAGCSSHKALYITCFKKKEVLKISVAGSSCSSSSSSSSSSVDQLDAGRRPLGPIHCAETNSNHKAESE